MGRNVNDSFSDGFNTNDTDRSYDSYDNYDGYDGYNGRCNYNSVTYASNSYDVNKRNYNSQIITNTEFQYMWDRLNAQQSKFGASQVSRPSVGIGTIATAAQANALINGFANLKSTSYSNNIDWSALNAIGSIGSGQKILNSYKEGVKTTLSRLEDQCRYCNYTSGYS